MGAWIIAYDVSDDKRRREVSKVLTNYGYRVQYSVFYLPQASDGEVYELKEKLKGHL